MADTDTLYFKTLSFPWKVTGPMFQTLNLMLETQYNKLWLAVDRIAERIRALGYPAPGTYAEFAKLASTKKSAGMPKAEEMIQLLGEGQAAVVRRARSVFPVSARQTTSPNADLLIQHMRTHEETAWMLRSLLEKSARIRDEAATPGAASLMRFHTRLG